MDPLPGVDFVPGDFREDSVVQQILALTGGKGVDVLLSDLAAGRGRGVLKPGGGALIKVFQEAGFRELTVSARRHFKTVRFIKPAASRARSAGIYLLAGGLRLV